ncbi:MAG: hypothetical protein P9X24_13395 [Candidatus Hatepunaea meridiana]|nr:hypothetical protein [Candidatus Hatepunaea meridiana]
MSFRVKVIPEDPTYNGYILQPLVSRIMRACNKPNARVSVLSNPKAKGYEHIKSLLVDQIMDGYSHFDLLLFLPDADGKDRSSEFVRLEDIAEKKGVRLLCCAAKEEIEIWLLAGHQDKLSESWFDIRSDVSVKENVFDPFLAEYGDSRRAGGGRDILIGETLRNYNGLKERCPELKDLEERIQDVFR